MRDPELQLVIAACRSSVDGKQVEVPPDDIRWSRFLALVNRHRVQALAWHGLKPMAGEIPVEVTRTLDRQAHRIVATNLGAAAECARLHQLFGDAGITLLFVKGLTLGALAYRNPFLKMSMDVDLLVGLERLANAARLLRSAGYVVVVPAGAGDPQLRRWHASRKESVWRRAEGNLQLDLHTRLADHPAMLAGVGLNSPSQAVTISPGITLPTLETDELFAYLCAHGSSSAWFRLKWITDLAAILRGKGPGEIERLYQRTQDLGAGRAAAQALLFAHRLYAIDIGRDLQARLSTDRVTRWLVQVAQRQLANPDEPTERMFGTATIHWSQLGLLPGWQFKLSEAARQMRDAIRPGA
jgi:hypothetical protein